MTMKYSGLGSRRSLDVRSRRAVTLSLSSTCKSFIELPLIKNSISDRYQVYGQNLFTHLRGEFAFVIFDGRRNLLLAARDRYGIKPLFYTVIGRRLLVASEIKAFLPFSRRDGKLEIDDGKSSSCWEPTWDLASLVNMGDYTDDRTVFEGVFKVCQGFPSTPSPYN
jgi:asparagine synthetase B (glutamine-hydrolysing)